MKKKKFHLKKMPIIMKNVYYYKQINKMAWEKKPLFFSFFFRSPFFCKHLQALTSHRLTAISNNATSMVAPLTATTPQTPASTPNSSQLVFSPIFLLFFFFLFSFIFFFHSSHRNIHYFNGSFCEILVIFHQKNHHLDSIHTFLSNFFFKPKFSRNLA